MSLFSKKKSARLYSLNKSKKTLNQVAKFYKRKKKNLTAQQQERFCSLADKLQNAIDEKNRAQASTLAKQLENLSEIHLKKNLLDHLLDLFLTLVFALILAIVVRQTWFELYKIPSGSMRPTLKEEDHLIVTKTDYGINTILKTGHLHFDPTLVQRGDVVVFSADGLDTDADTTYFYIIPGKKQFVKRLVGKPGDTIYYYGGKLYGVDSNNQPIESFQKDPWFTNIEHIPFLRLEGRDPTTPKVPMQGIYSPVYLYQTNQQVAKMFAQRSGLLDGEMLYPTSTLSRPKNYFDIWGFKHFSQVRLLTEDQVKTVTTHPIGLDADAALYLEIVHHPNLHPPIIGVDNHGRRRPMLSTESSIIPLTSDHIEKIFQNLYTARFIIKDGHAYRFGIQNAERLLPYFPRVSRKIPNGMYEFDNGTAYKVLWGGILQKLDEKHPLNDITPSNTAFLFNMGMDFSNALIPNKNAPLTLPTRFGYFFDHNLYLMGQPIFSKDDPALIAFLQKEQEKQAKATPLSPYYSFDDMPAPIKADGSLDLDIIKKQGLRIPEKMYLVLGDNHAMSADSREFGFVPQENLRGKALLIFWPFGSRFGWIQQPPRNIFSLPYVTIWLSASLIILASYLFYRKKTKKRISLR